MAKTRYDTPVEEVEWADVMPVGVFILACKMGEFTDYDGFGYPIKGDWVDKHNVIKPSKRHEIPEDAERIVWFNK